MREMEKAMNDLDKAMRDLAKVTADLVERTERLNRRLRALNELMGRRNRTEKTDRISRMAESQVTPAKGGEEPGIIAEVRKLLDGC